MVIVKNIIRNAKIFQPVLPMKVPKVLNVNQLFLKIIYQISVNIIIIQMITYTNVKQKLNAIHFILLIMKIYAFKLALIAHIQSMIILAQKKNYLALTQIFIKLVMIMKKLAKIRKQVSLIRSVL